MTALLCQRCKKSTATVHVTDLVGETKELHFCEECAGEQGITIKTPVPINTLLEDFIKNQSETQELTDLTCPECGMSFVQFRQQGVLGCPNDYDAFEKILSPLISQAQEGATHHVGKIPDQSSDTQKRQHVLLKLRRDLDDAVEREDYERAAKIRDELKELGES